jgi:hypothetical protein
MGTSPESGPMSRLSGQWRDRVGREQENHFARSCRGSPFRRSTFDELCYSTISLPGRQLKNTESAYGYPRSKDPDLLPTKAEPDASLKQERCYAGALTFEFYRFRFRFRSAGTLYFPPYKSGNIVRGAFGSIFRKLVCIPSCRDARICDVRTTCPYARIFEPQASRGEGPSGLADWPRPFVFRASHLDGSTIREGETFHFDVHIFDVRDAAIAHFVLAFAQLAREGLGPGRARADITAVDQLDLSGAPVKRVFVGEQFQMGALAAPIAVHISEPPGRIDCVRVRFVSPTELKSKHQVVERPEFGTLFGRLRDRISTLRTLYAAGPLEIDFRAMGRRASAVKMARCEVRRIEADRLSSRSGQRHPLSGFVGDAEYQGELTEFVPYLRLGQWLGVGRQTVWGKGEVEVNWEERQKSEI